MKTYSAADANPAALKQKTVVIYGYGSQGRAHARNLHDSGFNVVVAARPGASFDQARADAGRSEPSSGAP
jgi:ketol-acid reductoisomerase